MRLESITLHGFKSFGEKTRIEILPGITAIVGPNGCGKCLAGATPVVLADGSVVPIRTLVEQGLASATSFHRFDDGIAAVSEGLDVSVLSLNPETLRLEPRPVHAFVRRAAPPFLLCVRTRSGREITTTHYHPFFTLEAGAVKTLTAEQLVEGVRIAVPRTLPVKTSTTLPLDGAVLRAFQPGDRVYVPHSLALEHWVEMAAERIGGWSKLAQHVGVREQELRAVHEGRRVNVAVPGWIASQPWAPPIEVRAIQCSTRATIRIPPTFDGALARFLGYLIAEGRNTSAHQVWFVNGDPAVTAEFGRLAAEVFGVEPRDLRGKPRATDTLIFSRPLCLLLERVFGFAVDSRSADKSVPPQLWTSSDGVVAEFLSGLFEGDAFVHAPRMAAGKVRTHVEYMSASRRLAEDVATLLLRLGVFPLVRPKIRYATNTKSKRRRTYWAVYVYGLEQVQRLARRLRFVGAKQARLDAALATEAPANPNLDVVPGATVLVREAAALGRVPVKTLRPLSPRLAAYAEGRCEATRDGLLEVARLIERHAAAPDRARAVVRRLRALAESDAYWDEVVAIERIDPPEPWVYDLTVGDTHNFVAANVIVHNSNVGEAVRWALGEQSAKSLRGHRMEDLIFHGSASRKPVGLAEVELIFSNDGAVAIPFSEISVARRLYRTGDSEYLLNKSVCRLRDILDLLAGTGANPRAYSVMDQDKLNHVLTAKPHERRIFIEEAAGIARYKQQRTETQGKLEATRQNLLRVRDVMDEVKRQLTSLERQARKAQQYKTLQHERREIALVVAAADHASLARVSGELQDELGRLRTTETALRGRLAMLAGREALAREALQASDRRLSDLRQAVQKVQGELERLLERREHMGLQIREADEEALRLDDEIALTTERLAGIAGEREDLRRGLADAEALVGTRTESTRALEAAVDEQRAALGTDRDRLEALRLEQVRLAGERTDLGRGAGELRERQSQLQKRAERLATELAEAEAEAERLAARRAAMETAHDRALAELSSLALERESVESALGARERELAAATGRLAELRVELAARRSSLDSLRELERVREGYGEGVRALFADAAATGLRGIVGTVADLLEVPRALERPVEAVLGERLEWVVVRRFEDARAGVDFLHQRGAGAATFLPLECLEPRTGESIEPAAEAGEGNGHGGITSWIAGQIGAPSADLVRDLLGRVAIVDSLDRAEALWRRNGVVATYVTPAGEVLSPTGRLRGGIEAVSAEHSLLGRKRQIRDLEDAVHGLTGAVDELSGRVAGLDAETATLRARLPRVRDAISATEATRLASEKDLEQWVREQQRVQRHCETVGLEARQVAAEETETSTTLERLERRIAAARDAEAAQDAVMAALRETIDRAQEREAALTAELTTCRVDLASAAERVDALGRELGRLAELEAELGERVGQARQRQTQTRERAAWLGEERERTDVQARDVAVERDRLEEDARTAAIRHEELVGDLRAVETDIRAAEGEVRALTRSMHEVELKATEARVHREELVDDARRTWGVDADGLAARHDPARDPDGLRARVAELDEKLEAFGGVNLVADEEYRELEERLTFLRTQNEDLVASVKDLEKALRGMTRTAQERFAEAFNEINAQFSRLFERLFEGGRAELRLVEPEEGDDALETGVELMAQPRGKRLQSVTLLSGGERALTGLALLFAIFYHRPSPFCVLDEVDAPLDDANIVRFLRVLRDLTSQTQFLVITHNRKTMEVADVLYGVTMEEPGLSTLVSVNLNG